MTDSCSKVNSDLEVLSKEVLKVGLKGNSDLEVMCREAINITTTGPSVYMIPGWEVILALTWGICVVSHNMFYYTHGKEATTK